ncbi:MAG: hypothetical protein HFE84_06930 [Lachnospiraceae bacterium]|nr:hypothetical protein [Lachnospiraceae bacterium]
MEHKRLMGVRAVLKKKKHWVFGGIIVLQLFCIVYFANAKQGFFVDELWSYGLANSYYHPHVYYNDALEKQWVSGTYFKEYLEVSPEERFCYDSVIFNQKNDFHPPLFYLVLHTICSVFPNSFSKWYGIVPNIFYFIGISVLLYKLSRKILGETWLALLPSAIYGFSTGAISSVVYIRMYELMTMWMVFSAILHLELLERKCITIKNLAPILMISYLGYMTQYYFFIFTFFLALYCCIYLAMTKRGKALIGYCTTMYLSLCIVAFTFPTAFEKLFGEGRGGEAVKNLFELKTFLANVKSFYIILGQDLLADCQTLFIAAAMLSMLGIFVKKYIKINWKTDANQNGSEVITLTIRGFEKKLMVDGGAAGCIIVTLTMASYFFVIAKIAPYRMERYIFGIYPFAILGLICWGHWILKKYRVPLKYHFGIVLLVFSVVTIKGYYENRVHYIYPENKTALEISKHFEGRDCFYITWDYYKLAGNALELQNAERVYTMIPDNLEQLPGMIDFSKEDFIVYVDEGFDQEEILDQVKKYSGYKNCEKLFVSRCIAYKFFK